MIKPSLAALLLAGCTCSTPTTHQVTLVAPNVVATEEQSWELDPAPPYQEGIWLVVEMREVMLFGRVLFVRCDVVEVIEPSFK
jgi:hypothetical protein